MVNLSLLGTINCQSSLYPKAVEGIELFTAGHFFDSHEVLEAAWRDESLFKPVHNSKSEDL
jgi:predicted metal-dependent hydrolase